MTKGAYSGIYQIENKVTGKLYVGSAWNCWLRKTGHFNKLRANKHHSIKLQRSFNKYGEENFKFSIIEFCDEELLLNREQFWLDKLKPFYNICRIAGSSRGRKSSPAQLASLEKGWRKRAEILSIKVEQLSKEGKLIKVWDSISDACNALQLFPQSISFVCKGKQKTAGGFVWKYKAVGV